MSLYVDNATTPPWVKVYLDKATLPEVAAGLLRLLRCDTCGGTGRVEVDVPHAGIETWAEDRPCPCPDCVNGIRLPHLDKAAAAIEATYPNGPETDWTPEAEVAITAWLAALEAE